MDFQDLSRKVELLSIDISKNENEILLKKKNSLDFTKELAKRKQKIDAMKIMIDGRIQDQMATFDSALVRFV